MFEQKFKNIDDVLRKEAGCGTELDYAEQISWILLYIMRSRNYQIILDPPKSLIPPPSAFPL